MGMLRVLSRRGDDQYEWNVSQVEAGDQEAEAAVREAERIFREERARGSTAIRVQPGEAPQKIDEFDPHAKEIVMIPRVIGG